MGHRCKTEDIFQDTTTGHPIDLFNPQFVGKEVAREALQVFWERCTFAFVGKHVNASRRTRMVTSTNVGQRVRTGIMDLWLDIDIAGLGVLPRQHIRSVTLKILHGFNISKLEIPEVLFDTPLQHLTLVVPWETHGHAMKAKVDYALVMIRELEENHWSLKASGIVLVSALRFDTHVEGVSGDGSGQEDGSSDDEDNDDENNNDSETSVTKQQPMRTEFVDFDGCYELEEADWEVFIVARLTAKRMIGRDGQE
jgi:hypothetical protein